MHKESNADAKEETANDIIDITFLYRDYLMFPAVWSSDAK